MRKKLPPQIEQCRLRNGPMASAPAYGMNGFFLVKRKGERLKIMVSDGSEGDWEEAGFTGEPWEHVSVSLQHRCPSWNEMEYVKRLFWEPWETVMQIHPSLPEYVDCCSTCLHLWKPTRTKIPTPPRETLAP